MPPLRCGCTRTADPRRSGYARLLPSASMIQLKTAVRSSACETSPGVHRLSGLWDMRTGFCRVDQCHGLPRASSCVGLLEVLHWHLLFHGDVSGKIHASTAISFPLHVPEESHIALVCSPTTSKHLASTTAPTPNSKPTSRIPAPSGNILALLIPCV